MTEDGILEWRDADGELHRAGGPARVFPGGREEWYRHGKLHRIGGPAVVHANGSVKYYEDGVRHRDDGPACLYVNGTEKWYRRGLRHRDPADGPAAIYPDGRRIWFVDGVKVKSEKGPPAHLTPRPQRTKRISEYFGSGQRSSATTFSSLSATSRTSAIAASWLSRAYFASSRPSTPVGVLVGLLELVDRVGRATTSPRISAAEPVSAMLAASTEPE